MGLDSLLLQQSLYIGDAGWERVLQPATPLQAFALEYFDSLDVSTLHANRISSLGFYFATNVDELFLRLLFRTQGTLLRITKRPWPLHRSLCTSLLPKLWLFAHHIARTVCADTVDVDGYGAQSVVMGRTAPSSCSKSNAFLDFFTLESAVLALQAQLVVEYVALRKQDIRTSLVELFSAKPAELRDGTDLLAGYDKLHRDAFIFHQAVVKLVSCSFPEQLKSLEQFAAHAKDYILRLYKRAFCTLNESPYYPSWYFRTGGVERSVGPFRFHNMHSTIKPSSSSRQAVASCVPAVVEAKTDQVKRRSAVLRPSDSVPYAQLASKPSFSYPDTVPQATRHTFVEKGFDAPRSLLARSGRSFSKKPHRRGKESRSFDWLGCGC